MVDFTFMQKEKLRKYKIEQYRISLYDLYILFKWYKKELYEEKEYLLEKIDNLIKFLKTIKKDIGGN